MDPLLAALLGALAATGAIAAGAGVVAFARRRRAAAAAPTNPRGVSAVVPLVFAPVHALVDLVNTAVPEVRSLLAPGGEVGLLFSDIVGSTRLNHQLGDRRWAALLRRHDDLARQVVRTSGGRIVKNQGDGFMAAFHDAPSAVRAALALGPALRADADLGRLSVRVGVHVGEVVSERGDYFGTNVAKAARIAGEAVGGQVLVSREVADRLDRDAGDLVVLPHGGRRGTRLKGLQGRQELFEVRQA